MINDWVRVNPYDDNKSVMELYKAGIVTTDGGAYLNDEIQPIPLTAEMLKGNGWKHRKPLSIYYAEGMNFSLNVTHISDDSWRYDYVSITSKLVCTGKDIRYVHELQHALRLCGLNELADNWRV